MATVLLPIPSRDFDPTEVAVSWRVLSSLGHQVRFATPDGQPARADDLMVTGRGLPLLGRILRANADARKDYAPNGRDRDGMDDAGPAWLVRDGTYLSARWPGDVHTFAHTLATMLGGP